MAAEQDAGALLTLEDIRVFGPAQRRLFALCALMWGMSASFWFTGMQFLLPVFLSVTQQESQSYQSSAPGGSTTLLQVLIAPSCEFTAKVVKLVQTAVFVAASSMAARGRGLDRVYSTGAIASDQVALLIEHHLTEAADAVLYSAHEPFC